MCPLLKSVSLNWSSLESRFHFQILNITVEGGDLFCNMQLRREGTKSINFKKNGIKIKKSYSEWKYSPYLHQAFVSQISRETPIDQKTGKALDFFEFMQTNFRKTLQKHLLGCKSIKFQSITSQKSPHSPDKASFVKLPCAFYMKLKDLTKP